MFDHPPQGGDELWDFSTRAIFHQPTDYIGTAFHDLRRYFVPDNDREAAGHTYADTGLFAAAGTIGLWCVLGQLLFWIRHGR